MSACSTHLTVAAATHSRFVGFSDPIPTQPDPYSSTSTDSSNKHVCVSGHSCASLSPGSQLPEGLLQHIDDCQAPHEGHMLTKTLGFTYHDLWIAH